MLSTISGQALVDCFPEWCGTGHKTGANLAHVRFLLATEKMQIGEKKITFEDLRVHLQMECVRQGSLGHWNLGDGGEGRHSRQ